MKKIFSLFLLLIFTYPNGINAQSTSGKIDKLIKSYFETEKFMGTVLVAENGKILYRKSFGYANVELKVPNSPEGKFRIASITKTFTALLTMQLIQEGKLSLDNKISDFLPYYRKDIGERVTVHHLLTHSSGIPNYLQIPGFMPDQIKFPMKSIEEFIKAFCSNDLQFSPGEKFVYNNSGYAILGAIIEKVTGQTFEEALKKRILEPAGMKDSGLDKMDLILENRAYGYVRNLSGGFQPAPYWDMSTAYTAGQMYSTADDMFKYHQALLGEKLLSNVFKEKMFTKYYPAFGNYYGYGWMLRDLAVKEKSLVINSHEGGLPGFNLYFARIPEKNQVAVILNNTSDAPLKEISDNIFKILNGLEFKLPVKSLAREMLKIIYTSGSEAAIKFFKDKKATEKDRFEIVERDLNKAGYDLLAQKKLKEAVSVFNLMTEEFPGSGNAFDSLAEGYLTMGDKENAVKNYQKSIELDPKNTNAADMLKKLKNM
ncbi:MAG: serine hydrolase [Syntrophothermus sp.]